MLIDSVRSFAVSHLCLHEIEYYKIISWHEFSKGNHFRLTAGNLLGNLIATFCMNDVRARSAFKADAEFIFIHFHTFSFISIFYSIRIRNLRRKFAGCVFCVVELRFRSLPEHHEYGQESMFLLLVCDEHATVDCCSLPISLGGSERSMATIRTICENKIAFAYGVL